MNRSVASSGSVVSRRRLSSAAARAIFTACMLKIGAVVTSLSASRWSSSPYACTSAASGSTSAQWADRRVPLVAAGPVREERGEEHEPGAIDPCAGVGVLAGRDCRGVVPSDSVCVGDSVGDVEPAEVVVDVEVTGDVVAQHPFAHGVDDRVEYPVDPCAGAQCVRHGDDRRRAIRPEQRRPQPTVVDPGRVDRSPCEVHQVDAVERAHERAHVRQRVLAGTVTGSSGRGAAARCRLAPTRSCRAVRRPSGCRSPRARTTGDDR